MLVVFNLVRGLVSLKTNTSRHAQLTRRTSDVLPDTTTVTIDRIGELMSGY